MRLVLNSGMGFLRQKVYENLKIHSGPCFSVSKLSYIPIMREFIWGLFVQCHNLDFEPSKDQIQEGNYTIGWVIHVSFTLLVLLNVE